MDEIEYKLKTGTSVIVVNAIEKLINAIKSKFKPADRARFVLTNEELKFLRDKCSSKDTVVSLTACQGLLALVEGGILEIAHTMSTVITLLPSAHNHSAIVSTMAGLLILDLKSRLIPGQTYKCQFSFMSPQHPFITVLEKIEGATQDVLNQMHALSTHPDYVVQSNSLELMRPVFLWLCCGPQSSVAAWQLLISLQDINGQEELLLECLCWQQSANPKQVDSVLQAYKAVMDAAIYQDQKDLIVAMIPMIARLSYQMIIHGRDPRPCYSLISRCVSLEVPEMRLIAGLTVALLADILIVSCAAHLYELFHLCLTITTKYEVPLLPQSIFVSLTLQWLHLPSSLTNQALTIASKIIDNYVNLKNEDNKLVMPNLFKNKIFKKLSSTDERIAVYFRVMATFERYKDNPDKLRSWFDSIESTDDVCKLDLVGFLSGVALINRDGYYEDVCLKSIQMLVSLVDVKKDISVFLLPILVYKVAHDDSPEVKVECLKALPLMAKTKENVPTILSVLNKLKSSRDIPSSFLLELFRSLSVVQPRCASFLQELLAIADGREARIAAAYAIKESCEIRPSFGVSLVPLISSILNHADSESGGACRLALGALGALWRTGVLAPNATWRALEPKLGRDRRKMVQIGICELLGEAPPLYVATPEYDEFLINAATTLWKFISDSHEPDVIEAACDALAQFDITQYTLKCVPEIYTRTVRLPPAFCKTPIDAARKPEEVLDYIPCEIWPEVFSNTNQDALPSIAKLVSTLISREIKSFRSGVYQPETRGEPQTMSYLPPHSVLRGITDAVRKLALSRSHAQPAVVLYLVSSLTSEHPRPLPPMDLSFLLDLYHCADIYKAPSLLLATKQAQTSGSAKRMVETYLSGVDPEKMKDHEIVSLFELLPHLCRTLPPNSIRGPIEKCLRHTYDVIAQTSVKQTDGEEILFVKLLGLIKLCLENEKIHDANRMLIAQIVQEYWQIIDEDNVSWHPFISCCTSLPTKTLELMSSPSSWWEITPQLVRKAASLRCALAPCSLQWLSEVIDAAADCTSEQEFTLRQIATALRVADHEKARDWLLQLMARTQAANTENKEESARNYLYAVFALSVLCLSGHWSFEIEERLSLDCLLEVFPAAAAALFRREGWNEHASKLCEWLAHGAPGGRGALRALKGTKGFPNKAMWNVLK